MTTTVTDENDNLLEQLLELAVYLPVGLYLDSKGRVDDIVGRGRDHTTSQVRLARMIGQFAVTMGRKEVSRRLADAFARPAASPEAAAPAPAPAESASAAARPVRAATAVAKTAKAPKSTAASRSPKVAPKAAVLPIEGYDTLAASQIIARLDGLTARQLATVRTHESSHRNRKTILGRIDQLSTR